jgi:hypothetical protein
VRSHASPQAGIVQSLLITKHMLFIGFSLQDDNFHKYPQSSPSVISLASTNTIILNRVVDSVRQALSNRRHLPGRSSTHSFGTSLFLIHNDLMREVGAAPFGQCLIVLQLWSGELELLSMDQVVGTPKPEDWAYSARKLEIFLDFLSSESISTSPYLLDNKFEGLLDPVRAP